MSLRNKIFLATAVSGLVTLIAAISIIFISFRTSFEERIASHALGLARLTAANPEVIQAYSEIPPDAEELQRLAKTVLDTTDAVFAVFMDMHSIRFSHPNTLLIGKKFTGGDEDPALRGKAYSSKTVGISGPSIRGFAPIYDRNGVQRGAVAVGLWEPQISEIRDRVYPIIYVLIPVGLLAILGVSLLLTQNIKKAIFGMEPIEIATLLKERETTLENIREGIVVIDCQRRVRVVNQAAKEIIGVGSRWVGREIREMIPNSQLPRVLETRQAEYNNTLNVNGQAVLTNRLPMIVGGRVIGAVSTFRPLDEMSRLAEDLTGVKKIISALRARTHEFQNKLHVISGLIQLGSDHEARRYITDVTNYEQILLGFLINNIQHTAIAGLLAGKASEAEERNINFGIHKECALHFIPRNLDGNALVVVIGNLIENAFDAVSGQEPAQRMVEIKITQTETVLTITVQDSGGGIPPEVRHSLCREGVTTKKHGQGMGLYNVHKLVSAVEGRIEFETGNQGTTVTVQIPCKNKVSAVS